MSRRLPLDSMSLPANQYSEGKSAKEPVPQQIQPQRQYTSNDKHRPYPSQAPYSMTNQRPSTTAAAGGMNAVPKIGDVPGPANFHLVQGVLGVVDDEIDEKDVRYFQNNLESTPYTLANDSKNRMEGRMPSFPSNRKDAGATGSASLITPPRPIHPNPFDLGSLSRSFDGIVNSNSSSEKRSNGMLRTPESLWNETPSKVKTERKTQILGLKNWRDDAISDLQTPSPETSVDDSAAEINIKRYAPGIPVHAQQVAEVIGQRRAQVEEQYGPGAIEPFRPSHSVLEKLGMMPGLRAIRENELSAGGYNSSSNYLGDITIPNNRSADIPENENCSLWIIGLPALVTHKTLLGAIRGVGKIFASVISPPNGNHYTSAAKIVFFERSQAETLRMLILQGSFYVMGRQITDVRWNNIKSARFPRSEQSRAIRITGAENLMDFDFFELFFKCRFTYELDCRGRVPCGIPGKVSHEWRFGSLRCQAASAKTAIERELSDTYDVEWVRDPCE